MNSSTEELIKEIDSLLEKLYRNKDNLESTIDQCVEKVSGKLNRPLEEVSAFKQDLFRKYENLLEEKIIVLEAEKMFLEKYWKVVEE